jgi:hypothetical protein
MVLAGSAPDLGLNQTQTLIVLIACVLILGILVGRFAFMLRRGAMSGYRLGAHVVVRCRDGHLFTTTWIPMVSFKAVRLGYVRWQYCPVGRHMTFVVPVRDDDLTDIERRTAEHNDDGGIP